MTAPVDVAALIRAAHCHPDDEPDERHDACPDCCSWDLQRMCPDCIHYALT